MESLKAKANDIVIIFCHPFDGVDRIETIISKGDYPLGEIRQIGREKEFAGFDAVCRGKATFISTTENENDDKSSIASYISRSSPSPVSNRGRV